MDAQEFRSLREAYDAVYENQQLDEASSRDEFTRAAIARSSGRKGGITFEPGPNWDPSANRGKGAHLSPKQKEKQRRKALRQEEFELWVNELVEEGYDLSEYTWDEMFDIYEEEQLQELSNRKLRAYVKKSEKSHAELNKKWDQGTASYKDKYKSINREMGQERALKKLNKEEFNDIQEAEGSYGQTPKAREKMGKLAIARREKPASEYPQKGEKTKKVKAIEKHTQRIDNGPDVGNRGKKSTKPRHSGFLGKSGRGEMDQDRRDYARDSDVEYTAGGHKPGPGTVTKNPKKLRKQKAMGEIGESFDFFDVILEHLVAEGYADTNEAALAIMANMSEEWKQSIVEGDALRNTIKTLEGKRDAMNANKPGSANTAAPGKQSVGAATYKAYQRLRGV